MEQARLQVAVCIVPPALSELELIAAIDGEASLEVFDHLRCCAHCSERAHTLAQLQRHLRARLYRLFCPPSDQLAEYAQGLLDPYQHSVISQHLAICPHCAQEIVFMEQAVGYT
jgi:anti-sigma factor ChrR (cupin superfamily)